MRSATRVTFLNSALVASTKGPHLTELTGSQRDIDLSVALVALVAGTGKAALEAWQKHQYDLILMDVQMPEMDGLEATTAIRELEAASSGRHIPIIGLTAHAMVGYKEQCLGAGMDAYLSKPLQVKDLFAAIEHFCPSPHA